MADGKNKKDNKWKPVGKEKENTTSMKKWKPEEET